MNLSEDQWVDIVYVLSSYADRLAQDYDDSDKDTKIQYIKDLVEDVENSQSGMEVEFTLDEGDDE